MNKSEKMGQGSVGDVRASQVAGINRRRFVAMTALATGSLAAYPVRAQENVFESGLALGPAAARAIPLDYLGLSYETAQLADPAYFAADNGELVSLFQCSFRGRSATGREFE